MPGSNYPNGFPQGLVLRGVPIQVSYPGRIFWVGNNAANLQTGHKGGSDGNDGSFTAPFATLDYAIGRCQAGRGDIIFVKPGHAETISAAAGIALDVAGVAVIGLGSGTSRPTFTLGTANTASITVGAANVSVYNCIFVANFLNIATCFSLLTAGAQDFTADSCEFRDTSSVLNFVSCFTTSATANSVDGLTVYNCRRSSLSTAWAAFVVLSCTTARLTMSENKLFYAGANNNVCGFLNHAALVVTQAVIVHNLLYCVNTDTATGAIFILTSATTGSGFVSENEIRALDVAAAIIITATAVQYAMMDNIYIGDGTMNSGFLLPAAGSDA